MTASSAFTAYRRTIGNVTEPLRAAKYSDLFEDNHKETSDCAYCPICTTIGVVRNTKPELLDHLAKAARELLIVAEVMLEEAASFVGADATPPKPRPVPDDEQNVTRIDAG